ncbi:MAG: High-affinity zinc uptake system membrane protein ZnuB [candidate division BRC1 bacterium ADurb.BinA292]|nr:MAG: High-affinity zinc uptake system membrane protein ZnuB [candidate division BRC1 bacterium ADurb.BinA292]
MTEFFQSLAQHAHMQHALLAGLLASIAAGVVGTYVVVRRIVFISGGIAHAVLAGMGIAYWMEGDPFVGALIAAIVSALIIGLISLRAGQHEDTLIGALWAVGMAVGILFISRAPGYKVDLNSYLFGDILLVTRQDLLLIGVLDLAIVLAVIYFYREFQAVCFDEEYARLQGVPADLVYLLLLCLIALTVVTMIRLVGLILVIALLTLPAAIAQQYLRSLGRMMILGAILAFGFTFAGLAASYQPDLPAGSTIVLVAATAYLVSVAGRMIARRWRERS